jgi:hypothetical protein
MTDRIDKVFKENLEGYASPVSAGLWDGISQEMLRMRRRRWLLLLFILVVLSGLTLYYFSQDGESVPDHPVAQQSFAIANNDDVKSDATFTDSDRSIKNELAKRLDSRAVKNGPALKFVALTQASGSSDRAMAVHKPTLGALKEKRFGSSTLMPNPPVMVQQAAAYSYRCKNYPASLDAQSFFIDRALNLPFKSKTLGDCFEGPPTRYMLGFNASLDYPFRSIYGTNHSDLGDYISQRNSTESEFISFNAGIQSGYFHPSGFLLRSGLQYTQINEKFEYVKENVIKIQTQITIDTMINQDGSYTIHRDTSIVEVLGREVMKTSNHFRMLDIPLIFGYTFDWKRVSIEMNGGVVFNLLSRSGGRIFNTDLIPSYYGAKETEFSPFKTYYGLSLYGSISILSNFYGRTQFFLEPNARYYLKSFSSPDYPIRQKYFVLGLSTGMRYYF